MQQYPPFDPYNLIAFIEEPTIVVKTSRHTVITVYDKAVAEFIQKAVIYYSQRKGWADQGGWQNHAPSILEGLEIEVKYTPPEEPN